MAERTYLYQAEWWCSGCAKDLPHTDLPEIEYDSDDFVKGPYSDGGGEADTPQHCAKCGVHLENPLTSDGIDYVKAALADSRKDAWSVLSPTEQVWAEYYAL